MEGAVRRHYPEAEIISIPIADGGEGSVDALLIASGGQRRHATVKNLFFEDIEAAYGVINGGKTAVIETAACAGLPLAAGRQNPMKTTTYGVGQLIRQAAGGCRKIILGLGGSATNDAGCGAAAALGVRFFNRAGGEFIPVGGTLKDIRSIDISGVLPELKDVELTAMCDVDNPLYGDGGAAFVFAPQKGATPEMVAELDLGLRHLAGIVSGTGKKNAEDQAGAGAAGGMGYGLTVFLGANLRSGVETVLDAVGFDRLLAGVDMVFTGEGKIDAQSLRGKAVIGVAHRAAAAGVPVVAVVGDIGDGIQPVYDMGVSAVFSINRTAVDFSLARQRAENDLYLTMDNIMRFIKNIEGRG